MRKRNQCGATIDHPELTRSFSREIYNATLRARPIRYGDVDGAAGTNQSYPYSTA